MDILARKRQVSSGCGILESEGDTDRHGGGEQSGLVSTPSLLGSHPLPRSKGFQSRQLSSHFSVRRTSPSLSEVSPCLEYSILFKEF